MITVEVSDADIRCGSANNAIGDVEDCPVALAVQRALLNLGHREKVKVTRNDDGVVYIELKDRRWQAPNEVDMWVEDFDFCSHSDGPDEYGFRAFSFEIPNLDSSEWQKSQPLPSGRLP